ncbi:hypothetical protein VMCG_05323 [Cytospora schulzeri]|uniref:Mitochondrial import inner membrane translocase subunit Tim21 n=1 Tax=Cytospora schulzeri TaxID=448051 RepID=A0A423WQF8_9PEZI|nr:hypothetical protein VMCG_05323 [Valsa malicola]
MNTIATASISRPATFLSTCRSVAPLIARRTYASTDSSGSSSAASKRRAVTPFNDDGHVPWRDLSGAEKTARAAQQSFNFGFILVGVGLTGIVGYFLFTEVFSTESKVTYFNRAFDRIREDQRCLELLGDRRKIKAHGEETYNNWRRARPIAYVEGPLNRGSAHIHLIKPPGQSEHHYKYFYLDVKGHSRIYLEDDSGKQGSGGIGAKLFGIKWS